MKPIENVNYWRVPEIEGIEICQVVNSRHVFPDHAHDDIYAISLMEKGGSYCQGPHKSKSLVTPGDIALINPGQVHSGVPQQGKQTSYRMIYFDLKLMADTAGDISQHPYGAPEFHHLILKDSRLWRCMHQLYQVIQEPDGRLEKESAIMAAVAGLLTACGNVAPLKAIRSCRNRSIRHAMELLTENLEGKISLEEAARVAGLSRYHFLRVFKRETGLPPHLFRNLKRIDRAKELLRGGTSFSQTALKVGFSDQSHFTNTFRKYTGATPGQYLSNLAH
jgi:AraC-like DNA-binding protein